MKYTLGNLTTKKIKAGQYKITRHEDGEKYVVTKSTIKTIGWIIERQSDLAIYHGGCNDLVTAKLVIGKWKYF